MKILVILLALTNYVASIRVEFDTLVPHPGDKGGKFRISDPETYHKGPSESVISSEHAGASSQKQHAALSIAVGPAAASKQTTTSQQEFIVGTSSTETGVASEVETDRTRIITSGTVTNQGLNLRPSINRFSSSLLPLGHSALILETSKALTGGRLGVLQDHQIVIHDSIGSLPLLLNARIASFPPSIDTFQQFPNLIRSKSEPQLPPSADVCCLQTSRQTISTDPTVNQHVTVSTGADLRSTASVSDNSVINKSIDSSRLANHTANLVYQNEINSRINEYPFNFQQIDQSRMIQSLSDLNSKSVLPSSNTHPVASASAAIQLSSSSPPRYQVIHPLLGSLIAGLNSHAVRPVPKSTVAVSSPKNIQSTFNTATNQQQVSAQSQQSSVGNRVLINVPARALFSPFPQSDVNAEQFSVQKGTYSEYQNIDVLETNKGAIQNVVNEDINHEVRTSAGKISDLGENQIPVRIQSSNGPSRNPFSIPPVATATPFRPQIKFRKLFLLDPSVIPPENIIPPKIPLMPLPPAGTFVSRSRDNSHRTEEMSPQSIAMSAMSTTEEVAVSRPDESTNTIPEMTPIPRVEVAQVSAIPRGGLFPVPRARVFPHPRAQGIATATRIPGVTDRNNLLTDANTLLNHEANNINQNNITYNLTVGTSVPLPETGGPIASQGVLSSQLRRQGIDPSQIVFSQIPLSHVTILDSSAAVKSKSTALSFNEAYEDTSVVLANRYGRKTKKGSE